MTGVWRLGTPEFGPQSDQESNLGFDKEAKSERDEDAVLEEASPQEAPCSGGTERAFQDVQKQIRTYLTRIRDIHPSPPVRAGADSECDVDVPGSRQGRLRGDGRCFSRSACL